MAEVLGVLVAIALVVWVVLRILRSVVRWWVVALAILAAMALSSWEAEVKTFMDGFGGHVSSACCGPEEVP